MPLTGLISKLDKGEERIKELVHIRMPIETSQTEK